MPWANAMGRPPQHCTPFALPSNGIISFNGSSDVLTLATNAIFTPECTGVADAASYSSVDPTNTEDLRDPFYASTIPQIFVIGAVTVLSYVIFIMLLITPRSFFVGNGQGSARVLGRSTFVGGIPSTTSVVGVGGRPLLQKVAALFVAISLTIASVDSFKVAARQYNEGYEDATALTSEVAGGLEIRIVRVISDTLLWLAQAQTLIRLFPRHKEKVIIKWAGFALIVLDTIFSILNGFFTDPGRTRPRSYDDAIPALWYLFELALSLLYAAMVIYYSFSKRRFAFYHQQMRNICLVAFISLIAVLVPVVFFVLDIAKPDAAGWSDYVRWTGAAAASVVVWEWVERIEALEREERKDGVLGREIFDGDEMLDAMPAEEIHWMRHRRRRNDDDDDEKGFRPGSGGPGTFNDRSRAGGMRPAVISNRNNLYTPATGNHNQMAVGSGALMFPPPPLPVASPISRTDTTSASTVYAVHYHPVSEPSPAPHRRLSTRTNSAADIIPMSPTPEINDDDNEEPRGRSQNPPRPASNERVTTEPDLDLRVRWQVVPNPFKRRRASPPPEVMLANSSTPRPQSSISQVRPVSSQTDADKADFRTRLMAAASSQSARFRSKTKNERVPNHPRGRREERRTIDGRPLPVTVIPAQSRRPVNPASQGAESGLRRSETTNPVGACAEPQRSNSGTQQTEISRSNVPASATDRVSTSSVFPSRRILWEDRAAPSNNARASPATDPPVSGPSGSNREP